MRPAGRWILVVASVLVIAALLALYVDRPGPGASPGVTISTYNFQASASAICPYVAKSIPVAPISAAPGSVLQFRWSIVCDANSTPASSVLQSMYPLTHGFDLLSTNLPVTLNERSEATLAISVRVPPTPFAGELSFWVNATAG